jgi:hypothetical protein
MKIPTLIVSLVTALCIVGCSKEGGSSGKAKGLVPATVAELTASPDFKLEHTTESGIKCYVRELTPEVASTIAEDSRDDHFLERRKRPYLFVVVLDGKMVDFTEISAENPVFNTQQSGEVFAWGASRSLKADDFDKELQEMLKKAGKQ